MGLCMTIREKNQTASPPPRVNRYPLAIDIYARVMSVVIMLLGLRQWAIILGVMAGAGGMFEAMSTPWQVATMHLAVIDLVASVGLWIRVAWGNVVWIWAALAEIAMHSLFAQTFGEDYAIIAFHVVTLAGMGALVILGRRAESA